MTTGTLLVSKSVAGALGQLAWLLYKGRYRPLLDFEMHQKGGRGVIGSLRLLFYLRFSWRKLKSPPRVLLAFWHTLILDRPLQWLFAILSVGGFLASPLSQRAITYISPSVPIHNGTATAFRITAYSRSVGTTFKLGKVIRIICLQLFGSFLILQYIKFLTYN